MNYLSLLFKLESKLSNDPNVNPVTKHKKKIDCGFLYRPSAGPVPRKLPDIGHLNLKKVTM